MSLRKLLPSFVQWSVRLSEVKFLAYSNIQKEVNSIIIIIRDTGLRKKCTTGKIFKENC